MDTYIKDGQSDTHYSGGTFHSNLFFKKYLSTVLQDLQRCVDEDFPKGTELSKLEVQREAHDAFASVRCRVYIGRQNYFTEIDSHRADQIKQPFVLLGESGI